MESEEFRLPPGFGHNAALALGGELVASIRRPNTVPLNPNELPVKGINVYVVEKSREPIVVVKQAERLGHPLGDDDLLLLPDSAREAFDAWYSNFRRKQKEAQARVEY
jgi:hypothetical protein